MLVLVTYDVSTTDAKGRRRLSRVAKACLKFGQRVQDSVFECLVGPAELVLLRKALLDIINKEEDSVRIYFLHEAVRKKTEHYGIKRPLDYEEPFVV
jgi:CRISPR-associated protein Cas2